MAGHGTESLHTIFHTSTEVLRKTLSLDAPKSPSPVLIYFLLFYSCLQL